MKECVEILAMKEGITKAEAEKRMKSCLDVIAEKCVTGGVCFKGLFTLKKVARKGRSVILNGVPYKGKDKNILKITVGTELSGKLNK